jgi:hypothetical protein
MQSPAPKMAASWGGEASEDCLAPKRGFPLAAEECRHAQRGDIPLWGRAIAYEEAHRFSPSPNLGEGWGGGWSIRLSMAPS